MKTLLLLGAIATGMSLLAESVSLALPPLTAEQELSENPMGAGIVLVIFGLALLELILYLATVVFFCMWLYRSYNNLRALVPSHRLNYSAGWAVGSFFVPFVNWFVPYRAVKEVWQKSGRPDEALLCEPSAPAVFRLWWTFWLLASFAGNVALRVSLNENITASTATLISIVTGALSMIAALLAYRVVKAIDQRQEETSGMVRLGRFSEPPPPPANLSTVLS